MSSEDAPRTSSPSREPSEPFAVRVIVFECGHGDTILIGFPNDKWALVDCHLPNGHVRDRFFKLVESLGISRLEYIFQTHPDYDHFFGMTKVLEHFTRDGRSVGYWCDGGLYAQSIQSLIWPDAVSKKHYTKLQADLDQLDDDGRIQFIELNDRVEVTSCEGYESIVDLMPLGPSARTKRRVTREDLKKLQENPAAKMEANRLSVILALLIDHKNEEWNFLLPGDAGAEEIDGALDAWSKRSAMEKADLHLDVIKVPHHGSLASHNEALPTMTRNDRAERFAVISAGTRPKLPDRTVIEEFLRHSWCVMSTTRQQAETPQPSRPMTLASRQPIEASSILTHDIEISWHSETRLNAKPEAAILSREDTSLYETASAKR